LVEGIQILVNFEGEKMYSDFGQKTDFGQKCRFAKKWIPILKRVQIYVKIQDSDLNIRFWSKIWHLTPSSVIERIFK